MDTFTANGMTETTIPFEKVPYLIRVNYDPNVVLSAKMVQREDGSIRWYSVIVGPESRKFEDCYFYGDNGWELNVTIRRSQSEQTA